MTSRNDERRPVRGGVTVEENLVYDPTIVTGLDARREVALRVPPLDHVLGIGLHRHDPWTCEPERAPSKWGMPTGDLVAYARHLRSGGWLPWEIRAVLDVAA